MTILRVKAPTSQAKINQAYLALGLRKKIRQTIADEANAFSRSLHVYCSYLRKNIDRTTPEYVDEAVVRLAKVVRQKQYVENRFSFSELVNAGVCSGYLKGAIHSGKSNELLKKRGTINMAALSASDVEAIGQLDNVGGQTLGDLITIREICVQMKHAIVPSVTDDFGIESCALLSRAIAKLPNPLFRKEFSTFLAKHEKS